MIEKTPERLADPGHRLHKDGHAIRIYLDKLPNPWNIKMAARYWQ
jgi:hypothetical protein